MRSIGHEERGMKRSLHSPLNRIAMEVLKKVRLKSGKTQQELARRIRRPQSFVSLYEKSQRGISLAEFLEIADGLEVDTCDLIKEIRAAAGHGRLRLG
jgi:transcriptional regulator with XRE-family HTH domain